MHLRKLSLFVALVFGLIFSVHSEASAKITFPDLSASHPQYNEIHYLVDLGVINGVPMNGKTYFMPERSVTRAEVAKMIVIAAGHTPKNVSKSSFSDVPVDVMTGYIEKAVELGFMSPTSSGKFSPNTAIHRDEMSKVLVKAFNINTSATKQLAVPFTDISSSNAYYEYVSALYYNGITNGIGNGLYGLNKEVRRDAFSTFVARIKNNTYALAKPNIGEPAPDESTATARIYSTSNSLNVRTAPTTSADVIGQIHNGDKLWAFEVKNGWVKVSFGGRTGYVSQSYVQFIDEDGMTFKLTGGVSKKLIDQATVYRGTSESSKVVAHLAKGTSVQTFGSNGVWTVVTVNGIPGYVDSGNFEESTPAPTQPIEQLGDTVGKVTVSSLNIRKSASASSEIVGKLTKGDVVNVHSISGWWASISYNGVQGYVHKTYLHLMNTKGSSVKNRIIVLDPGHGGKDSGATNGSVYEKNIVLDVSKRLQTLLTNAGAKVVLTRSTDVFIDLDERPRIAERNYGEMFISVHVNSHTTEVPQGTETFYNSSRDTNLNEEITLAKYINNEIVQNAGMINRGVKYGNLAVTRPLEMPAVLVELGFIKNPSDVKKLTDDKYLQIFAQSLFNAIEEYYKYN